MRGVQRDETIEALRGLACLCVVVYHVIGYDAANGLRAADGTWLRAVADGFDAFHMPAFALIAGLVFALSPPRPGATLRFLRRRLTRIGLPLLVGTSVYLAALQVAATNTDAPDALWQAYLFPFMHFWYLQAILWVIAAAVLAERLGCLKGRWLELAILAAVAIYMVRAQLPMVFSLRLAAYLLPFFLVGVWLARSARAAGSGLAVLAPLSLGAAALAGWLALAGGFIEAPPVIANVLKLVAGLGLSIGLLRTRLAPGWLVRLGSVSYAVYLYHVFGTAAAREGLLALGQTSLALHLLVGTAVGIALPVAFRAALLQFGRIAPALPLTVIGEAPSRRAAAGPMAGPAVPSPAAEAGGGGQAPNPPSMVCCAPVTMPASDPTR